MNPLSEVWSMSRAQLSEYMNDHLSDRSMSDISDGSISDISDGSISDISDRSVTSPTPPQGVYLGVSLGLPTWVKSLTWSIFVKVIITHPKSGSLIGWNMRIEQTPHLVQGLRDVPISYRMKGGVPWAFGPFSVEREERSLCLNYRYLPKIHTPTLYSPLRSLRDPIISLSSHRATVLLGRSDVEVFGRRYSTPSWFTLEHQGLAPPEVIEAGLTFWRDDLDE